MAEHAPGTGSLLFIGTATTLIRYGGFAVPTDPNFLHRGQRAYLGYGLSSPRRTEPSCSVRELPALDAVVLSHLHGDHFDRIARHGLDHDLPVLTTPAAARRLQRWRFRQASGLRTWRSHTLGGAGRTLRVTAVPARHAAGAAAHLLPPVMGSILEYRDATGRTDLRVYLSGDTVAVPALAQIPDRFGDIDLAVLHLGGTTLPGGLLVTMNARQGLDTMRLMGAAATLPVHYDDYPVFRSPLSAFRRLVDDTGWRDRVRYLDRGDTMALRGRVGTPAGDRPPAG